MKRSVAATRPKTLSLSCARTATLKAGETYHAVVGQRKLHGHRDLRILHHDGKQPLWI